MREGFVFYQSFANAALMLGEKARLKLYDSVIKLGLSCAESVPELEQVCAEIESKLVRNRNVFAQFLLIKPQIFANFKRYLNGLKGKEFGVLGAPFGELGGRPSQKDKNPPKEKEKEKENVNSNFLPNPPRQMEEKKVGREV